MTMSTEVGRLSYCALRLRGRLVRRGCMFPPEPTTSQGTIPPMELMLTPLRARVTIDTASLGRSGTAAVSAGVYAFAR